VAAFSFSSVCQFDHNLIIGQCRISILQALFEHKLISYSTITWSKG
jgi:hypothetical protein